MFARVRVSRLSGSFDPAFRRSVPLAATSLRGVAALEEGKGHEGMGRSMLDDGIVPTG